MINITMDARNNIATDLFYKIRSRFAGLKLGAETGEITINPEEARFFDFDYMEGENPIGHVSISLAEPNSMKVYFSHGITEAMDVGQKNNWYGFLKELRFFAKRRLLNFDTRDIAKDNLDKRDYQFLSQYAKPNQQSNNSVSNPVGESIMSESNMYGSRTISYQKLMDTRLIIKHSQAIVDDIAPGARSRNISALFVENEDGERFKYPFIHLAGARAMQRHVANGGKPYDSIGESIIKMSEEIAQLRSFSNYVVRNDLMNSQNNQIVERGTAALNKLREQIARLAKQSHYEAYKESFQAQQPLEMPQGVVEDFTDKFTVRNFKEEISSVFPVLYRLMQEENTVGYDDIVAMTSQEQTKNKASNQYNDPFAKFEAWAMGLGESSAIQSSDPDEQQAAVQQLQSIVGQHFQVGVDGTNAVESLKGLIEDPRLDQQIKQASKANPDTDCRGIVKDWLTANAPEALENLDFGDFQSDSDMNGQPDAQQAVAPTEGIDEANLSPWKQGKRYKSDYNKRPKPEEFGVKPNSWGDKPHPTWKSVPKPNARYDWEKDYVYDNPEEKAAYDQAGKDYYDQPEYKEYMKAVQKWHDDEKKAALNFRKDQGGYDLELTITNPYFDMHPGDQGIGVDDPNEPEDDEEDEEPEEIEVGINYTVSGRYYPATREEPAEYPDIEIDNIVDLETGEDITDMVSDDTRDWIIEKISENNESDDRDYDEGTDMQEGPDKKDIPAAQRKASGDKDWKVTRQDLDKEKDSRISHRDTLAKNSGKMNVQELAEFIHSFYDKNSGTFPKGPEGVAVMVGKKFGEQAEQVARKMVERMAPQQATNQNPELQELMRIKELSGIR